MKNNNFVWAHCFLFSTLILSACSQSPDINQQSNNNKNNSGFPVPFAITALPDVNSLSASLDCPDGTTVPMPISDQKTATGSCKNISPGTNKTFTIHFFYSLGSTQIELARDTKTFDVVAGNNPTLFFDINSYDETFDDDSDGFNNLYEVVNNMDPTQRNFKLSGTVTGLNGTVTLSNGTDELTLTTNDSFTFSTYPLDGTSYSIAVKTQPSDYGQTCTIANGEGILTGEVTDISIHCTQWVWMGGSQNTNVAGNYQTPATPGARDGATTWTDANGLLWLFGGAGYDSAGNYGYLNDLWTYDTATNQWTWISGSDTKDAGGNYGTQGTPLASNTSGPGARADTVKWIDANGIFWLFGGYGYDSAGNAGELSDLWQYDTSTNQWTWINGPNTANVKGDYGTLGKPLSTNAPGGRYGALTWVDGNGLVWLFGGDGTDMNGAYGLLSDLWNYDPATNLWTWIAGSKTKDITATYGAPGVPVNTNDPGGRYYSSTWTNSSDDLCLFGGVGVDASAVKNYFNDVWCYNVPAHLWTWIGGSNKFNTTGTYGTRGLTALDNMPGARDGSATWLDKNGQLWLFGGYGYDSTKSIGGLNDLWRYDILTNQWVWMGGSNTVNASSIFNSQGVIDATNSPGERAGPAAWNDGNNQFWLMGGIDFGANGVTLDLNDLWKLQP